MLRAVLAIFLLFTSIPAHAQTADDYVEVAKSYGAGNRIVEALAQRSFAAP